MRALLILASILILVISLGAYVDPANPNGMITTPGVHYFNNVAEPPTDGISITGWTAMATGPGTYLSSQFIYNGKIYVYTYIEGGSAVNRDYIIGSNSWENAPAEPNASWGSNYAFDGAKFWQFGGCHAGSYHAQIRVFDTATNTWTAKGNIPSTVCGSYWYRGQALYLGSGKILVFGGSTAGGWGSGGTTASKLVVIYDTASDSWIRAADLPVAAAYQGSGYIGSKFYCIGGFNTSQTCVPNTYIYDQSTNTWSSGPSLPAARAYPTCVSNANGIYCIGGESTVGGSEMNTVYALFVGQANWQSDEPLPVGRSKQPYAAANGYDIYVGGGANSGWQTHTEFWKGTGKNVGFDFSGAFARIPQNSRIAKISPNPWHDNADVRIFFDSRAIGKKASIIVYDIAGHVVYTSSSTCNAAGYKNYSIGRSFTSGAYIFTFKVDGKVIDTKKAVKL